MKAILYARFGAYPKQFERLVRDFGFEIVDKDPEIVLSIGGDGTLLGAERDYPEIPKLPLRDSRICHVCSEISPEESLRLFSEGKMVMKDYLKLEVGVNNEVHQVLNETAIRNTLINSALRFRLKIDGKENEEEYIGDGLVVATPFGSTGYFSSITRKNFEEGTGIGFNNLYGKFFDPLILPENSQIEIKITRGPAQASVDNYPKIFELETEDIVTVKKSPQVARIYSSTFGV